MSDILRYFEELKTSTPAQLAACGWTEIPLDDYWEFMECVPPIRIKDNAFMVGECITHGVAGGIYDACAQVNERYFTRPDYLLHFNPARYTAEIKKQFNL